MSENDKDLYEKTNERLYQMAQKEKEVHYKRMQEAEKSTFVRVTNWIFANAGLIVLCGIFCWYEYKLVIACLAVYGLCFLLINSGKK